jgi:RNA polymerase sigma-70 factor (ECF subfamily)
VSEQTREELAQLVAPTVRAATARWPGIQLSPERFADYLAPLVGDGELDKLHGEDLYLACALADGDVQAAAIFEADFLAPLRLPSLRAAASSDFLDEVRQRLRERVLVQKRIRGYSGKGPLGGWLRVAATRLALDLEADARRRQRVEAVPDEAMPAPQPEQLLLRARYRQPIEAAFQHAFEQLDDDERGLLRQHYLDGVSLQDMGDALGVDRSTVSRRVAAAREELLASVKRELGRALQLTPASIDTLVDALKSQLVITLRALR